jgi:hypothetical protein
VPRGLETAAEDKVRNEGSGMREYGRWTLRIM